MLSKIQKVEQEVRDAIEAAKHEAATAVQRAHTEVADARVKLEEELRAKEAAAIAAAEEEAKRQAADMITKANQAHNGAIPVEAEQIAKELLASYLK